MALQNPHPPPLQPLTACVLLCIILWLYQPTQPCFAHYQPLVAVTVEYWFWFSKYVFCFFMIIIIIVITVVIIIIIVTWVHKYTHSYFKCTKLWFHVKCLFPWSVIQANILVLKASWLNGLQYSMRAWCMLFLMLTWQEWVLLIQKNFNIILNFSEGVETITPQSPSPLPLCLMSIPWWFYRRDEKILPIVHQTLSYVSWGHHSWYFIIMMNYG